MVLLVLDASVVLKWFLQENHSDAALKIREKFYNEVHGIVEPDLLIYEFTNVLRYNVNYSADNIKKALSSLIEMDFDIVLPTLEMANNAVDLAKKYNITVYDAIFVSLAMLIDATFVTADENLHKKIKELDFVKFIAEFK